MLALVRFPTSGLQHRSQTASPISGFSLPFRAQDFVEKNHQQDEQRRCSRLSSIVGARLPRRCRNTVRCWRKPAARPLASGLLVDMAAPRRFLGRAARWRLGQLEAGHIWRVHKSSARRRSANLDPFDIIDCRRCSGSWPQPLLLCDGTAARRRRRGIDGRCGTDQAPHPLRARRWCAPRVHTSAYSRHCH